MNTVEHPLSHLRWALEAAIGKEDADWLRDVLAGRFPLAVGGDEDPAQLLLQAVELMPYNQKTVSGLTDLLARVLNQHRTVLQKTLSSHSPAAQDRFLTLNCCWLAAELPPQKELFDALEVFLTAVEILGENPDLELQSAFVQALIFQQIDSSLESLWYQILEAGAEAAEKRPAGSSPLIFDAWRGLLWMPSNWADNFNTDRVPFGRIHRGLLYLGKSMHGAADRQNQLRLALEILFRTFPRTIEFWETQLAPWLAKSRSQDFRQLAYELWEFQQDQLVREPRSTAGLHELDTDVSKKTTNRSSSDTARVGERTLLARTIDPCDDLGGLESLRNALETIEPTGLGFRKKAS